METYTKKYLQPVFCGLLSCWSSRIFRWINMWWQSQMVWRSLWRWSFPPPFSKKSADESMHWFRIKSGSKLNMVARASWRIRGNFHNIQQERVEQLQRDILMSLWLNVKYLAHLNEWYDGRLRYKCKASDQRYDKAIVPELSGFTSDGTIHLEIKGCKSIIRKRPCEKHSRWFPEQN